MLGRMQSNTPALQELAGLCQYLDSVINHVTVHSLLSWETRVPDVMETALFNLGLNEDMGYVSRRHCVLHSASVVDCISPRVKSGVKNSSCKCIGSENVAIGKDRLNNQIPDTSILKATSIKVSLTGPRETASHHGFLCGLEPAR